MVAWEDVEVGGGDELDLDWVVVTVWVLGQFDDDGGAGAARMSLKWTKKTKQLTDGDVEMMMSLMKRFGYYDYYYFQQPERLAS